MGAGPGRDRLTGHLTGSPDRVSRSLSREVDHGCHLLFLVAFGLAVLTTGLMIAPVMLHRFLFGRRAKDTVVRVGNLLVKAAMASLGLTMAGVARKAGTS